MCTGLFHKGILQSMGLNTLWDINQNPLAQAKKQATVLNCPNDTSIQIVDCLRKKDAQEIADTFVDMYVSTIFKVINMYIEEAYTHREENIKI